MSDKHVRHENLAQGMPTWEEGRQPEADLLPYLKRLRRRLRLRDGWQLIQATAWWAGLACGLILLAGRVWPIEKLGVWALAPWGLWLIGVLGYSLLRSLPPMRVARQVDAELGLKERLSTSLALDALREPTAGSAGALLATFQPDLVDIQQRDALETARRIRVNQDFPLRFARKPWLAAAALVVVAIVLARLPNPMDKVLAEREAVRHAAEQQARQVEKVNQEIQKAQELSPEEREELQRQLEELSKQLRLNPGDREEALAQLSKVEESLRQKLDPNGEARQAALQAMAAQLQSLAKSETGQQEGDLAAAAEALQKLAEQMKSMDAAQQQELAKSLAQMAARLAQSGDANLAQSLAAMAQALQSGDASAASQAAQNAAQAMAQAQSQMAAQAAIQQALSQVQSSRQAMAQAGQSAVAQGQTGQGPGQGQNPGQGNNPGQGQNPGQGPGSGQSQNPSQGQSAGSGGGSKANTLPPATRSGRAGSPQGPGQSAPLGDLKASVYAPRERMATNGDKLYIPGQDTGQGETQAHEQRDPLPGAAGPALVPYDQVFSSYLDSANQAMDQSYIPSGLKDYVRQYFSELEP